MSLTAYSQDTTKPYCLTPPERRFVLSQAYQLQECDSLQKSLKTQVFQLNTVVFDDKLLISNMAEQKYLMSEQLHAKNNDVEFLKKQLHVALVKNKRQRLLTYSVAVLGTLTTGWFIFH